MSKFVIADQGVPVYEFPDRLPTDPQQNTVYLRRKLDAGARLRIQEAAIHHEAMIEIYKQSVLRWEGPDFRGIKCTPENVERMDVDDPFWERVGDKIAELNPWMQGDEPNPLVSTTPTEPGSPASTPSASDDSTTK